MTISSGAQFLGVMNCLVVSYDGLERRNILAGQTAGRNSPDAPRTSAHLLDFDCYSLFRLHLFFVICREALPTRGQLGSEE